MATAQEITARLKVWHEEQQKRDRYSWFSNGGLWDDVHERIDNRWHQGNNSKNQPVDFGGGSVIKLVEDFGGEGQGDDYWIVMEITVDDEPPRLYRVEGWYASYDGGYLDGDLHEVRPKEVLRTIYERV